MDATPETYKRTRRKMPADRRREIVEMGATIGLAEGLSKVTARRLADGIGVRPGLVTHYFPTVDELLAEVFTTLAADGRLGFHPEDSTAHSPTNYVQGLIRRYASTERDPVSLMWLDAWRQAADREQLRAAVLLQMEKDVENLTVVIDRGVSTGEFSTKDPSRTAMRIFGILDGQIVASVVRAAAPESPLDYSAVVDLAYESAERELGLSSGSLGQK